VRDPVGLGGMTRGNVTPYWARTERPAWFREVVGEKRPISASGDRNGP
jgi:hypothetical protein